MPRRRPPWWAWILVAGAVLIGGIAAVGGFNDVPAQALPRIELGETYSTNEVEVTVLSAVISEGSAFHGFTDDGKVHVIVAVEATALTNAPSRFARELIRVLIEDVIDPGTAATVRELRNGDPVGSLQPRLPVRLAYEWEVPQDSVRPGDEIIVGVFEQYDAPDSPIFDDAKSAPTAVVRVVTTLKAAP